MQHLNYHHLRYFWVTAGRGTLVGAAKELHVSPSTISTQLRLLEDQLGEPLFVRHGRRLVLTELGRVVQSYADEIFALGHDLQRAVTERAGGLRRRCVIGLSDGVAKLVAMRLLEPAFSVSDDLQFVIEERPADELVAGLVTHRYDVVLHDGPVPPNGPARVYSHLLGSSDVEWFAPREQAPRLKRTFPRSLHGVAVVLPCRASPLRGALERWFEHLDVRPRVRAEVEDSALLKVLGQAGLGVFPAESAIRDEVERLYDVKSVGVADGVVERTFALSVERRIRHPAVQAILDAGRTDVFA